MTHHLKFGWGYIVDIKFLVLGLSNTLIKNTFCIAFQGKINHVTNHTHPETSQNAMNSMNGK